MTQKTINIALIMASDAISGRPSLGYFPESSEIAMNNGNMTSHNLIADSSDVDSGTNIPASEKIISSAVSLLRLIIIRDTVKNATKETSAPDISDKLWK